MADANNDKLTIRLHVYDTEMAVNVLRVEEALYRDAAILITETINSYAAYYKGRKSEKELMYMAMIDIALKHERLRRKNDTQPFVNVMQSLTEEIEHALVENGQKQ